MEKSHKTCMEQAYIIDTFGTYQSAMTQDDMMNYMGNGAMMQNGGVRKRGASED